jgi:hypothetical protein
MTEPDELLSKADALLARGRAGAGAPQPPADYPVLTEVVDAPMETPPVAAPEPTGEATRLPPVDVAPVLSAADTRALEERVRLRVLETMGPHLQRVLDDRLQSSLEDLSRRLAVNIAANARNEIVALVREAVRHAVARELQAKTGDREGGR